MIRHIKELRTICLIIGVLFCLIQSGFGQPWKETAGKGFKDVAKSVYRIARFNTAKEQAATVLGEKNEVCIALGYLTEGFSLLKQRSKLKAARTLEKALPFVKKEFGEKSIDYMILLFYVGKSYAEYAQPKDREKVVIKDKGVLRAFRALKKAYSFLDKKRKQKRLGRMESGLLNKILEMQGGLYIASKQYGKLHAFFHEHLEFYKRYFWSEAGKYRAVLRNLGSSWRNFAKVKKEGIWRQDRRRYDSIAHFYAAQLPLFALKVGTNTSEYRRVLERTISHFNRAGNKAEYEKYSLLYKKIRKFDISDLNATGELFGKKDQLYAIALGERAKSLVSDSAKEYSEVIKLYEEAIGIYESIPGLEHKSYAEALTKSGDIYFLLGKRTLAERNYLKAIKMWEKNVRKPNSTSHSLVRDLARHFHKYAYKLVEKHKYSLAKVYYKKSLKYVKDKEVEKELAAISGTTTATKKPGILTKNVGSKNVAPKKWQRTFGLAFLAFGRKRIFKATELFETSLVLAKKEFGEQHNNYAITLYQVAKVYQAQDKYDLAESYYLKVIEWMKEYSKENYLTAKASQDLAHIYIARKKYMLAKQFLKKAIFSFGKHKQMHPKKTVPPDLAPQLTVLEAQMTTGNSPKPANNIGSASDHWKALKTKAQLASNFKMYGLAIRWYTLRKQLISKKHGVYHTQHLEAVYDLANTYAVSGQFRKADPLYQATSELSQKLLGAQSKAYAQHLQKLGVIYKKQKKYARAEALFTQSYEVVLQKFTPDSKEAKAAQKEILTLHIEQKQIKKLENFQDKILVYYKEALKDKGRYRDYLSGLGKYYATRGAYSSAQKYYQKALEVPADYEWEQREAYHGLGNIYRNRHAYYETEQAFLKAKQKHGVTKNTSADHISWNYPWLLSDWGQLYVEQGLYEKAGIMFKEVIAITKERKEKAKDVEYLILLNRIGALRYTQNKFDEAEALFKLVLTKNIFFEQFLQVQTQINLANVYISQKKYDKARDLYIDTQDILFAKYGRKHAYYAMILNKLGNLYALWKKYLQAESHIKEAISIVENTLGKKSTEYAYYLNDLVSLYHKEGKFEKAAPLYSQGIQRILDLIGQNFESFDDHDFQAYLTIIDPYVQRFQGFVLDYVNKYPEKKYMLTTLFNIRLVTKAQRLNAKKKLRRIVAKSSDEKLKKKYKEYLEYRNKVATFVNYIDFFIFTICLSVNSIQNVETTAWSDEGFQYEHNSKDVVTGQKFYFTVTFSFTGCSF